MIIKPLHRQYRNSGKTVEKRLSNDAENSKERAGKAQLTTVDKRLSINDDDDETASNPEVKDRRNSSAKYDDALLCRYFKS